MNYIDNITQIIGKTPLLRMNNIEKEFGLKCRLFAKLEYLNPTGSVKDRTALQIITDAKNKGLIKKNATIIEATSGNTGIALASICASLGYKLILTMPESMSVERQKILKFYGAELVLTPKNLGMQGAVDKAIALSEIIENSFVVNQFNNESNLMAHYSSTGKEIYEDLDGKIDILFATFGTGGTISGIAKYLKEQDKNIKVIGIEPEDSPLLSKGYSSTHNIQGIGANFVPKILQKELIDEIIIANEYECYEYCKIIARKQGFGVGISSGAVLSSALKYIKANNLENKNIVLVLPDSADRYYSTKLFND